jgi:hypothetical protein
MKVTKPLILNFFSTKDALLLKSHPASASLEYTQPHKPVEQKKKKGANQVILMETA